MAASPNLPQLTPEQVELLRTFEKGVRLRDATMTPGWKDVLDIMEVRVAQAEFQLMNCNYADKEIVYALQKRARAMREFFQNVQGDIQAAIDAAANVPQIASTQVGLPGAQW